MRENLALREQADELGSRLRAAERQRIWAQQLRSELAEARQNLHEAELLLQKQAAAAAAASPPVTPDASPEKLMKPIGPAGEEAAEAVARELAALRAQLDAKTTELAESEPPPPLPTRHPPHVFTCPAHPFSMPRQQAEHLLRSASPVRQVGRTAVSEYGLRKSCSASRSPR